MFILVVRWILLEVDVLKSAFSEEEGELVNQVVPSLREEEKIWVSGYL